MFRSLVAMLLALPMLVFLVGVMGANYVFNATSFAEVLIEDFDFAHPPSLHF